MLAAAASVPPAEAMRLLVLKRRNKAIGTTSVKITVRRLPGALDSNAEKPTPSSR
jgi:hypothetical protein